MSGQLPLYMLPAALMRLEALPYNSSGKLDRKALPAPAVSEPQAYVAPATELEQQLCALWQAALQCGQVGMTDDFFLLGGTSIKAISLCVGMGELMAAPVPVVQLLQSRTLKNLLAANERRLVLPLNRWAEGAPVVWMIHPALVGAEAFHAFAQPLQGRFNCYGVDNHNLYHQPAIDSLGDLAERYLNDMIAAGLLQGAGPVRILGWSLGGSSRWRLPPVWKRAAAVTCNCICWTASTGRPRRSCLWSSCCRRWASRARRRHAPWPQGRRSGGCRKGG